MNARRHNEHDGRATERDLAAFGRAARSHAPETPPYLATRVMAAVDEAEAADALRPRSLLGRQLGFAFGGLAVAGLCLVLTFSLMRSPESPLVSGPSVADVWETLFGEPPAVALFDAPDFHSFADPEAEARTLALLGSAATDLPLLGPMADAHAGDGLFDLLETDHDDDSDLTFGGQLS